MNIPDTDSHLSDRQFTDLLLGTIPPAVSAHLESCSACAVEARKVSGAISTFEHQSLLWAQLRASGQQPVSVPRRHPAMAWLQSPVGIASWSTAAAALLLSATLGVQRMQHAPVVNPIPTALSDQQQISPARLKEDNELLYAIDGELSAEKAPPASVYGLQPGDTATHTRRSRKVSNE